MRILKDNYTNYVKVVKNNKIVCETCQSELEYDKSDIQYGEFGCAYIMCPLCDKKIFLDYEEPICLTVDNIVFPQHFHHASQDAVEISAKEIQEWIKEGIDYFRENKNEDYWYRQSGDTHVAIYRYGGDKDYNTIVTKDYYETYIPFEKSDYLNEESEQEDEYAWLNGL